MKDRTGEKLERWLANIPLPRDAQFEQEILNNSLLANEAYSVLELNDALREAALPEISMIRSSRMHFSQRWAWASGLVAALLAFVLLLPQSKYLDADLLPRLRGSGDSRPAVGYLPKGEMSNFPRTFVWHPANSQSPARYRWELYDSQSRQRGVAVVSDTTVVRSFNQTPDDSLGTWRWLVVELMSNGMEGPTSNATSFTVKAKGGP